MRRRMTDFARAAEVARRVLELTPSIPGRKTDKDLIFLRHFPRGSCDLMAYATGGMLKDEGLGDWWVVIQSRASSPDRHVWLEWRNDDASPAFSIDTSAHQIAEIEEPFVGPGATPARRLFPEPVSAVRFSQLPHHWPRSGDLALLEYIRSQWR